MQRLQLVALLVPGAVEALDLALGLGDPCAGVLRVQLQRLPMLPNHLREAIGAAAGPGSNRATACSGRLPATSGTRLCCHPSSFACRGSMPYMAGDIGHE